MKFLPLFLKMSSSWKVSFLPLGILWLIFRPSFQFIGFMRWLSDPDEFESHWKTLIFSMKISSDPSLFWSSISTSNFTSFKVVSFILSSFVKSKETKLIKLWYRYFCCWIQRKVHLFKSEESAGQLSFHCSLPFETFESGWWLQQCYGTL